MEDESQILEAAIPQNPAAAGQNAFRGATGTAAPAPQPNVQVPHAQPAQAPQQAPNGQQTLQMLMALGKERLGDKEFQKAFPQLAALAPPELIGPDVIGKISPGMPSRGGIMGTGMEPIDVLAFAFGAAITGNLPQDQAIAATMRIAGLPGQFRDNQRKAAAAFMQDQMQLIQLETGQRNASVNEANAVTERMKQLQAEKMMEGLDKLEAHIINGTMTPELRRMGMLRAKQWGISDAMAKELFFDTDASTQLARINAVREQAQAQGLGHVSGTLDLPGGQTIRVGEANTGRSTTQTDLAMFAATGRRGATIPPEMTQEEAKRATDMIRENRQVLVPAAQQQRIDIAGSSALATAGARQQVAAVKSLADLQSTNEIINNLDELSKTIITAEGAGAAMKQRLKLTAGAAAKTNEAAALYKDQMNGFLSNLSRSIMAERGVLTEGDVDRARQSLPQFGDTKNIRDKKIAWLKRVTNSLAEVEAILAQGGQAPIEKVTAMKKLLHSDPMKLGPAPAGSDVAPNGVRRITRDNNGNLVQPEYAPQGSVPAPRPQSTTKELPKDF